MDQGITFIANYGEWQSIKKIKITEKTDPKTILEFLASLTVGVERKVEENLKKIVDLKQIDDFILEGIGGEKTEQSIAMALSALAGAKFSKLLNSICNIESLQKNEQEEIKDFCRVYAYKKTFNKLGLITDFSNIKIPGLKTLMKKATKME